MGEINQINSGCSRLHRIFSYFTIAFFIVSTLRDTQSRAVDCTDHAGWHFINEINQFRFSSLLPWLLAEFWVPHFALFLFFFFFCLGGSLVSSVSGIWWRFLRCLSVWDLDIYVGVFGIEAVRCGVFSWRLFTICQRRPTCRIYELNCLFYDCSSFA